MVIEKETGNSGEKAGDQKTAKNVQNGLPNGHLESTEPSAPVTTAKDSKTVDDKAADLSEEEKKLKEELEGCVATICDEAQTDLEPWKSAPSDAAVAGAGASVERRHARHHSLTEKLEALQRMRDLIRTATSSMTSVPKPLKFLRPHYARLKKYHATTLSRSSAAWTQLSEIISVLGMMMTKGRDVLHYRLICQPKQTSALSEWGHEYMNHLSMEVQQEWLELNGTSIPDTENEADTAGAKDAKGEKGKEEGEGKEKEKEKEGGEKDKEKKEEAKSAKELEKQAREAAERAEREREMQLQYPDVVGPTAIEMNGDQKEPRKADLFRLSLLIVPYLMANNAEADAVDLLATLERLDRLPEFVDATTYKRVCLYITSCVPYVHESENLILLKTAVDLYRKFNEHAQALRFTMQLNDVDLTKDIFFGCREHALQLQLAFLLARQQVFVELDADKIRDQIESGSGSGSGPATEASVGGGGTDPATSSTGFSLKRQMDMINEMDAGHLSDLKETLNNAQLNRYFLALAKELDIMEPKIPEDIYKTHLEPVRSNTMGGAQLDSARANLASSFVNGLVNCGFGKDRLLLGDTSEAASKQWIYKTKETGQLSTTASLGWLLLWDVDGGLSQIDKYLYSDNEHIKAGAVLACGVINSGVRNECEPAKALLEDYLRQDRHSLLRTSAIIGLGVAYAGSNRDEILQLLYPIFQDDKANMELISLTALSCGLIAVGSSNGELTQNLTLKLMDLSDSELRDTYAKFFALALGLNYLGKQDQCEVALSALEAVAEPMAKIAKPMVNMCAYAGTGNVIQIQAFLKMCYDSVEQISQLATAATAPATTGTATSGAAGTARSTAPGEAATLGAAGTGSTVGTGGTGAGSSGGFPGGSLASILAGIGGATRQPPENQAVTAERKKAEEERKRQEDLIYLREGIAVLGVALMAMSEEVGSEMAVRLFGHMLRYGDPVARRAVPLALALNSLSNPKLTVLETLNKYAHDMDVEVACNSILAMGLCGAGTNNSRLASMLRQLAVFHSKEPNALFMVRIAQGLTHLGKGTLTLCPFHSDRTLLNPVALAALLALLVAALDVKTLLLGKSHYLLYYLTPAIQPRMLVTLDEKLNSKPVMVRVGQAVDVVAQAGNPKTITGFQTHTTPVLLAYGERAELATEEYLPLSPVLEGFVLLRKNPEYHEKDSH